MNLLLAFALAFPAQAAAEESQLLSYDLRSVLPRWDANPSWGQTLVWPPATGPYRDFDDEDVFLGYADLAAFELLDLLTQILGDELRREGREMIVEGHHLTALAPPSLHEQLRAVLDGLEAALGGTNTVRVDVLGSSEGAGELPPAGVLASSEEVERHIAELLARGATHKSYTLELSAGRTAVLDAFRRIPYIHDHRVEIAQGMVVYAPSVAATRDGTRLLLRGLPVPGGLALSTVLLLSDLLELPTQPLKMRGMVHNTEAGGTTVLAGPDNLQSPEVLERALAFDAFLPDGKALALTFEAALGRARSREVLFLRRSGGTMNSYVARPIPRTNKTVIALDAELFRPARLNHSAEPWRDDYGVAHPSASTRFDGEPSAFLLEWLKARFSVWRRFGPWILIVTDPAWDRDAAAQLERLVKSLQTNTVQRGVQVELQHAGQAPLVPVRIRLPLLEGSSAGFVLARGKTAVTGYEVEVAQAAAVTLATVSPVFEGLALAFSLEGTRLEASGMAQLFDGPIAAQELNYELFGAVERPEPLQLRFDERLQLEAGRTLRIGGTSARAGTTTLALEIRLAPTPR